MFNNLKKQDFEQKKQKIIEKYNYLDSHFEKNQFSLIAKGICRVGHDSF